MVSLNGPRGLIEEDGSAVTVLVPPGNPTVLPELEMLLPRDMSVIQRRLPVGDGSLKSRLLNYNSSLSRVVNDIPEDQSAAVGLACTGSSYLVGPGGDAALAASMRKSSGLSAITAAGAVSATLALMARTRIAVVSPYPDWLTELAVAYWKAVGLEVVQVIKVPAPRGIYAIEEKVVIESARKVQASNGLAVLMSGTGMSTVDAIREISTSLEAPVISSNLALALQFQYMSDASSRQQHSLATQLIGKWQ